MAGGPEPGRPAHRRRQDVLQCPVLTPAQVREIALECAKMLAEEERLIRETGRVPHSHITINRVDNLTLVFSSEAQMTQFNNEFKEKVANVAQGNQGPVAQGNRAQANQFGNIGTATPDEQATLLAALAPDLTRLLTAMREQSAPDDADHEVELDVVERAEESAKSGKAARAVALLKKLGQGTLDLATKITATVAAEAIMQATGLKPSVTPAKL